MSYKFASYTSVWAGPREFRRMASSVSDKMDQMFVHIGRYNGYDDQEKLKADSLKVFDVAAEYGCNTIYSQPMTEYDKRRRAPLMARDFNVDFLLIIDSDEYLDKIKTQWEGFKQSCIDIAIDKYHGQYNIFGIQVEDGPQTFRAMPRLWYQPEFVYYDNTHYGLKSSNPRCPFNQDKTYENAEKHPFPEVIPFLTIRSDNSFRTEYQIQSRKDYAYVLNNLDNYGLSRKKSIGH